MRCAWALCLFLALSWPCRAGNGDANLNGVVDLADAAAALRFAAGLATPAFGARVAADVPKYRTPAGPGPIDGAITVMDAVEIARIAAGLDRPLPSHALPTWVSVPSSGDVTLNVALDAGCRVSGQIRDYLENAFTGRVAYYRWTTASIPTPSYAYSADVPSGAYTLTLPASQYTPVFLRDVVATTPLRGVTHTIVPDTILNGSPPIVYTIGGDMAAFDLQAHSALYGLNTVYVSTQTEAGASYVSREIHLSFATDNGTELWGAHRTVAPDSGAWSVPTGTYAVRFVGETTLSDNTVEPWTYYVDRYYVPNTYSLVPVMGPFVEVSGTVTPPVGFTAKSVQLLALDAIASYPSTIYRPNPNKVMATVPIGADGSYRIAGMKERYAVVFTATSPEFTVKYMAVYRFGTDPSTWNARMPQAWSARTVSGQVVGPDGRPVANAPVEISYPPYITVTYSTQTVTDAQGRYSARIPNGTYNLRVTP